MSAETTTPTDERRETRLALTAAVGLWTLLFGPFVVSPGLPVFRDLLLTYLPLHRFWAEQVSRFELPTWFPYEGLGRAFIGQGVTATFHPVNALYLLFDDALAMRLEIGSALLVALLGQVVLARQLRLRAVAAVTGGFAFILSGYALSMTSNTSYLRGLSMLPWVALFAVRVMSAPPAWGSAAGLAVAWGLIPLGGDAASTLLAAAVVGAVWVGHGLTPKQPLLITAGAAALAGLLAAPELLPASALHPDSIVAGFQNADFLSRFWALHPERLPELLLRGVGDPWAPLPSVAELHEPGRWSESVLLGAPVVALALSVERRRLPLAFLGIGVLGLWLALGTHGGLDLLLRKLLPPLNSVRYPEKHLALAVFGFATAAAFGVERLLKEPRSFLRAAAITAALVLAARLGTGHDGANLALITALAPTAALLALPWLHARSPWAAWLAPVLISLSLFQQPLGLITVPEDVLKTPARVPVAGRVWVERATHLTPTDAASLEAWAREEVASLSGDLGLFHRQSSFGLTANLPLAPKRERALLGWKLSETRALAPLFGFDAALRADGLNEALLDAVPRARVASSRSLADPRQLKPELLANPNEARRRPLVLGPQPPPVEGVIGAVAFRLDEPARVVLDAELEAPGLVVLNDLVAEGWRVSVDDQPAPLLVVNGLVRGVTVAAGTHRVQFTYEAPRLALGLTLGAVGWALVLGLVLLALREPRRA